MGKRSRKSDSKSFASTETSKDVGSDNEDMGDIFTDEIDEFTQARNKVKFGPEVSDSDDEEAILPLQGDEDEDDSDEELGEWSRRLKQIKFQNKLAKNKIKGDKAEGSWGNRREDYYGSFAKKNLRRVAADDDDEWTLEAKEVDKLQAKLDEEVDEDDFMIPSLTPSLKSTDKVKQLVVKQDLTDKEKKQHQDMLHPEVEPLRLELNKCLEELELLKDSKGWRFESKDTCFRLLAANIAFYLHLVESGDDCRGHPVLKRIVQWKKLAKMYHEIPDHLLEASEDEENGIDETIARLQPDVDSDNALPEDEMENGQEDQKDEGELGSRPITYQMKKNKVSKSKSKHNNPRVKHREKFRKAKVRRRGQVREYRPEINKYQGEASGIRSGITKSIRLH